MVTLTYLLVGKTLNVFWCANQIYKFRTRLSVTYMYEGCPKISWTNAFSLECGVTSK